MENYISEIDVLNRIKINNLTYKADRNDFSFNTNILHMSKARLEKVTKPTLTNQQRNKLKQKT
jgi:hypothetical protein